MRLAQKSSPGIYVLRNTWVFTGLVSYQPADSTMDLLVAVKITTHAQQPFDRVVCSCFPKVVMLTMEHDKYSANWFLQNVNVDLLIQLHF